MYEKYHKWTLSSRIKSSEISMETNSETRKSQVRLFYEIEPNNEYFSYNYNRIQF